MVTVEPLLVVLVGPTGSGKTALSLALAERLGGEVVSCDSVAVYREMELGTAKPSREERTRVPHHLIDVAWPSEEYTAGDYGRAAREAVAGIAVRGHVPIVAGGTGLYLRALLDGLSPVPQRDEALRDRLRAAADRRGPALLHRVLRRLDPANAAKIHANDLPKLIRAIEVSVMEGRPMSEAWSDRRPQPLTGFRVVQLGLMPDRAALYERINARCAAMYADGLVQETRALVAKYGSTRALGALGYAEAQAVLRGEMTEPEAVERAQIGHRNYSKRQGTWFRRDPRIQWIEGFGGEVLEEALHMIEATNG
ncbi:tRNA (adenosine(37)-N6)-dimethylallyltransferase MiaA [Terriglobus roseus]|uniref:tRNA (adenosine(37)-N6)-dimethylallyltransferase MiaA n=1 Tax=Terriglobus roseus TaxID=392734 RepID=UPI000944D4F5|nr:tRNA (adenosine(37)-N6)-dimethylallyltransferase MiaA [Terriglobus roseus]